MKGKIRKLWVTLLCTTLAMTQLPATILADSFTPPPTITETVAEENVANSMLLKTVTDWTFLDDEILNEGELSLFNVSMEQPTDFDTVVSMLPTQIRAQIENREDPDTITVTGWVCPEYIQDNHSNWPLTGDYVFTAALPDDYTCNPLPTVRVALGSVQTYSELIKGDGYSFNPNNGQLTISTIKGTTNWCLNNRITTSAILSVKIEDDVTRIRDNAFANCTGLTSIDLSNLTKLTSIGNSTFYGCTNLRDIDKLPTSLTSIGNYTFSGCTSLTSINLSNLMNLTNIGNYTFSRCTNLISINKLPTSLTSIGDSTFSNCTNLTDIDKLPTSLTSIGDSTFSRCTKLTNINLSNLTSLTSIGNSIFFKCTNLTGIGNLPPNLTSIGDYMFSDCTSLKSIDNLPSNLTNIGLSTFSNCTSLTSINFTNLTSLISIGTSTFSGCTSLTDIGPLPSGLTSIGYSTFSGCTNLKSINLYNLMSLTSIGDSTFSNCTNLTDINLSNLTSLTSIGNSTFFKCTHLKGIDKLPPNLTSIGNHTFSYCAGLKSIDNLPSDLTSIGNHTFSYCTGLTNINLTNLTSLISIGAFTFSSCTSLTDIEKLPSNLTSIENYTFSGCTSLTSINLSKLMNLTNIGNYTFWTCTSLTEIIFPEGVTSVGNGILSDCKNLKAIVFLGLQAPTFGIGMWDNIPPAPVVYVLEGAKGYDSLNPQTMAAPSITAQPQSVTVQTGNTATFTVAADGVPSPSLQWQVYTRNDWINVTDGTGGDTDTYTTPEVRVEMDSWMYRCVITNFAGTVTTNATMLTIDAKRPSITVQPTGGTYSQNASVTLTVNANVNDGGTLSYQWYRNTTDSTAGGTVIPSATSDSYIVPTGSTGTTYYYVVVTNTNTRVNGHTTARITSNIAKIRIYSLTNAATPVITEQPQGGTYIQNANITLTVKARVNDGGTLSYQWYRNTTDNTTSGTVIPDAASDTFTVPADTAGTAYYYVVVTNTNTRVNGHTTAKITSYPAEIIIKELIKVEAITLTSTSITLELGDINSLHAVVTPEDAHNKAVVWKTSNKNVAAVSASGEVTAVKAGTATITCTAADGGGAKATCKVTVRNTATPLIILKGTAGKNSIRLNWNEISNADGYEIYGSRCGGTDRYKKIKTITKGTAKTWTQRKLKAATAYKYYIKTYKLVNGRKLYLRISKTSHVVTTGGKYTNVKSITTTFTDITLEKGKTRQISARVTPLKKGRKLAEHVPEFRYKTSNSKVAAATASGKITAVRKGKCSVYVYANNGVTRRIQITVN